MCIFLHTHVYKSYVYVCTYIGLLGTGQIFGELCVLNPKIVSSISGIAYTKVEMFTIDGEELITQGILLYIYLYVYVYLNIYR
jgi:hypothetical protein